MIGTRVGHCCLGADKIKKGLHGFSSEVLFQKNSNPRLLECPCGYGQATVIRLESDDNVCLCSETAYVTQAHFELIIYPRLALTLQ